ncbi:hypothetical protein J18TS1_27990 [Oceanobacillus oncorhynchi subsp. incaldanensis]|nr:hypothetical protein J18TS1_27990 [Oceanobacillus oncorhynchi subsp. incaldanensis]
MYAGVGFFASVLVPIIAIFPTTFIVIIARLAMISVILDAFQEAFDTKKGFQIGAFFTFIIAVSGISIFGVGALFWELLVGVLDSAVLESREFKDMNYEGAA